VVVVLMLLVAVDVVVALDEDDDEEPRLDLVLLRTTLDWFVTAEGGKFAIMMISASSSCAADVSSPVFSTTLTEDEDDGDIANVFAGDCVEELAFAAATAARVAALPVLRRVAIFEAGITTATAGEDECVAGLLLVVVVVVEDDADDDPSSFAALLSDGASDTGAAADSDGARVAGGGGGFVDPRVLRRVLYVLIISIVYLENLDV